MAWREREAWCRTRCGASWEVIAAARGLDAASTCAPLRGLGGRFSSDEGLVGFRGALVGNAVVGVEGGEEKRREGGLRGRRTPSTAVVSCRGLAIYAEQKSNRSLLCVENIEDAGIERSGNKGGKAC